MPDTLEWDVLAILVASIIGIVLHTLGILPEVYITSLILLLLALHALHGMVHGTKESEVHKKLLEAAAKIGEPDVSLIEPKEVFERGQDLAMRNAGEMWWFNTPLGFREQRFFDRLLRPAIENPRTSRIIFVLNEGFKNAWDEEVVPKINECKGREKVLPPIWKKIDEAISFKMIDLSQEREVKEAHLTLLGRPFVMKAGKESQTFHPRYIFHVKSHSKLIQDLKDMFLEYRLKEGP